MSTDAASAVDTLLAPLPDACKDLRLNMSTMLRGSGIDQPTTYCSAIAVAYFVGAKALAEALRADSASLLSAEDVTDAEAAAALMGMTTVYYKSRELLGKPTYGQMRPSLRMNRMMSPVSRQRYEAASFACAAVAACPACLQSHEAKLLETGLSEAAVHDLIRLAAVVHGASIAIGIVN